MTVAGKLGPTGGRSSDDAEKDTRERRAQVGRSLRHRGHDQRDRLLVVFRHCCHQSALANKWLSQAVKSVDGPP